MALRAKIRPDEAESEGCGGSTVEDENEVWPDFRRNHSGRGQFSSFRRRSSLADTRYASLLIPRTEKNWLPAPPASVGLTGPKLLARRQVVQPCAASEMRVGQHEPGEPMSAAPAP